MTMQMQIYTSAQKFNLVTWWPDSHGNDKTHTNASNTSQGEIESNLVNTFENRQFLKDNLENYEISFPNEEVNYDAWRGIISWKKLWPSQRLQEIYFAEYWPFALPSSFVTSSPQPCSSAQAWWWCRRTWASSRQPSTTHPRRSPQSWAGCC